ncbi:unnamed protein product, partial [marine sediment metagenome]
MAKLTEKQEQAWRRLAEEIGGQFVPKEGRRLGVRYTEHRVVARVGKWTITLGTAERSSGGSEYHSGSTYTVTCVRAPYVATNRFHFQITHD